MTFFLDNNLSPRLAKAGTEIGEKVTHLTEIFAPDTPDEDWLRWVGDKGYFLVTRDDRIRWRPAQIAALKRHAVGAFFLGGDHLSRCQIIQTLVKHWPRIRDLAAATRRPFGFCVPSRGSRIERLRWSQ